MSLSRRPVAGFVLSLISSIFIVLNAAWLSLGYTFAIFYLTLRRAYPIVGEPHMLVGTQPLLYLTILGAICGLIVLVGAYCLYKGRNVLGGILVIVFSILSLPTGGGFIIGFILGVVGGALALAGI